MKKILTIITAVISVLLHSTELKIICTADLHGNLPALAELSPVIRRNKADLLLDAGDLIGGNAVTELSGGLNMIKALNILKYDCRVPGNHDFEISRSDFHRAVKFFNGNTLGGDWSWGQCCGLPWVIKKVKNIKCGIIGLTEPGIARRHLRGSAGPSFTDHNTVLRRSIEQLRKKDPDIIILLWHNGLGWGGKSAARIIRRYPEINILFAGHSHRENPGIRLGSTYAVQAGAHGSSAALITLKFDRKFRKIKNIRSELLRPNPARKDMRLKALYDHHKKLHISVLEQLIAPPGTLRPRNFDRLAAQALADYGKCDGAVFSYRPLAKTPARSSLYHLFRLLPYRNLLCKVTLTRKELLAFMDELYRKSRLYGSRFSFCGFSYQPYENKPPGKIKAPASLTLVVNDYLLSSSKVLFHLQNEKSKRYTVLPDIERAVISDYLSRNVPIKP